MRYFIFLSLIFLNLFPNIRSQSYTKIPPDKPRLIVGIVVDQLRYDQLYRYWDKLSDDGFKKLIDNGAVCKNTFIGFQLTESAATHATIATGTQPYNHGITGDYWFNRFEEERNYCVDDPNQMTIGSSSHYGRLSPKNLLASTIGDELKISTNGESKVIAISLKDHAAIFLSGHTADQAYWFDDEYGQWISSSFYTEALPEWVIDFNLKNLPETYLTRDWTASLDMDEYTASRDDKTTFEPGFGKRQNSLPYNLKKIRNNSIDQDYSLLRSTPYGNTYTSDFAAAAFLNEDLGTDLFTDLIQISFSATDYIGHRFGPFSVEYQDAIIKLDLEIAHLIEVIEDKLGREKVLFYITASHGAAVTPAYYSALKIPSGQFRYRNATALLNSYLNAIHGNGKWVSDYYNNQIYLNHQLILDSKLDLSEIQTQTAHFMIQFNGVSQAVATTNIEKTHFTDGPFAKIQKSFFPSRVGDVILNLQPGWIDETDDATNHSSSYNYDAHIPLIWYGWKINRQVINRQVHQADIAPTLSNLLNISFPNASTGNIIWELNK